MKTLSLDLFALGVTATKNAHPLDRSKGFFNVNAMADIARVNLGEKPLDNARSVNQFVRHSNAKDLAK